MKELSKYFKLCDLGPTDFILGVQITRDRPNRRLCLSQRQYVVDTLALYNHADCKPVSTPMLPGLRLSTSMAPQSDEDKEYMRKVPYANAVGKLLYLATATRPDIAFAVSTLCRLISNPGPAHWKVVQHLFRYLQGTKDMKLTYSPSNSTELFTSYSDADHGGNPDNGKLTSAYVVCIGTGTVSWSSKLQTIVAQSTTEAEYVAAVDAGKEVVWMHNLLLEFGYKLPGPSVLHMDNQSAISVSKNPEHHGRMKQLDLCFFWLQDAVEQELITPRFIPTEEMPAYALTKPLP